MSAPNSPAAMDKDSAAPSEESSGGVGQTISDAAITTSVKSKLIANSGTSGRNIKVKTENGVVMLSGQVKSESEKTLALQIAGSTKGVKNVQDGLVVSGSGSS
jgi:hyperosmotically inducible protein